MLRRVIETALAAAIFLVGLGPTAHARFYDKIEKPWALASLLEIAIIAGCGALLSRSRHARWAGVAFALTLGWGVLRVWLDPMFDPMLGVTMRNVELSASARIGYQLGLFALVIIPLATSLWVSARSGHFVRLPWRRAVTPGYMFMVALLIGSPEMMELTIF